MKHWIYIAVALGLGVSFPAAAQKAGQNATVTLGIVQSAERVTLQSTGGGKGAVVGGTLGYASGSSKSKSRRNALIGGAAGAALSSSGKSEGMQYAVRVGDGSVIVVVSDQTQIQIGDCVTVEQSGDLANIRRQDPLACQNQQASSSPDVQAEFVDDADKCAAAKRELLDATTKEELELATAKANILCE
jgi:outer membrane lipoprotein SlyB